MHKKDVVKKVLRDYIKKGHDFFELTPSYLGNLKELKGYSERTLKRGRTEFKNENKNLVSRHSKSSANLKKKIYLHLNNNPGATPKKLSQSFPKVDAKQLSKIRTMWKNEHSGPNLKEAKKATTNASSRRKVKAADTPFISAKNRVMNYLSTYPNSKIRDVKKALPELNPSSVNTYFSMWRKSQKEDGNNIITPRKRGRPAGSTAAKNTKDDIIKALKETVEAQKKAIEALRSQNDILKERQSYVFPELEGMDKKDVRKVENILQTFIRGMKNG